MRTFTIAIFTVLFIGFNYSASAADGKVVYSAKCRVCHSEDGTGNKGMADLKKVDILVLNLTSDKNKKKSDADIQKIVREGQGTMKAILIDKLSDNDLKTVIAYIRTLQKVKK